MKLGKIKLEGCSWARTGLVNLEPLKAWVQRNDSIGLLLCPGRWLCGAEGMLAVSEVVTVIQVRW